MSFRQISLSISMVTLLGASLVATGQVAIGGAYHFGVFDARGLDTVNVGNLNVHFEIPIFYKVGRGGLNFNHSLIYDSSIWTPVGVSGSKTWQPAPLWGWQSDTNAFTGNLAFTTKNLLCGRTNPPTYIQTQGQFAYTDWDGTVHSFNVFPLISYDSCPTVPTQSGGSFQASDNSGMVLIGSWSNYSIQLRNGTLIYPTYNQAANSTNITDANGNQITSTGTTFRDTTGAVVLTLSGGGTASSPRVLTYPDYVSGNASTAATTIYYSAYSVQTAFGCSGISEYSASSVNLVDHIVLADGQTYTLTYEATPGVSGKVTGRLASIKLPGGGRIDYAYSGGSHGIECQDGGTATLTRSMPDDPAGSSWTYTRTPGASGADNSHTDVVDGVSNHAAYDFINDPADAYHTPYVVNQDQYNGPVSGTPLVAQASCYNGATTCIGESLTLPITEAVVTTTLDGASVKKSNQSFNTSGLLTSQTDYDFGSGSPGSQVDSTSITYASLGNGIVSLPLTVTVSGSQTAPIQRTDYSYDGGTLLTTAGLPQHVSIAGSRGNLTSVTTATQSLFVPVTTQTNTYDDAGQFKSSTDARGNVTTYGYDSSTDAFLISASAPATGTITHNTGATYDDASGVTLTSTDQNGNVSSYTYDNMLRPITVSLPASEAQSYTYSLA